MLQQFRGLPEVFSPAAEVAELPMPESLLVPAARLEGEDLIRQERREPPGRIYRRADLDQVTTADVVDDRTHARQRYRHERDTAANLAL